MRASLKTPLAIVALLAFTVPASASLIQGPNLSIPGGVGNSNVILSLQRQGNASTESGAVTPTGCTGPDIQGACLGVGNMVRTLSSAGIGSASALTLFLDAAEPNNNPSITLTGLTLNVYGAGANNSLVFSAPFAVGVLPLNLTSSPGQGNNPVSTFILNDVEAAQLQALFDPNLRVGLSASFSNADGGPDRFFLGARTVTPPPVGVPEPASMALLGAGLFGLGLLRRNRA